MLPTIEWTDDAVVMVDQRKLPAEEIYVRCTTPQDVARANVLALQSDCEDEVFNVASGHETSLRELAGALLKVMDATHLTAEYGPERSINPVSRRLASTRKAQALLGFRAEVGLEEGLDRLVRWWQKNRPLEVAA